MFKTASNIFNSVLRRLRGAQEESQKGSSVTKPRDALFPMRELAARNKELAAARKRLKKEALYKIAVPKPIIIAEPNEDSDGLEVGGGTLLSPVINVSCICDNTKSSIFEEAFLERCKSQSLSYTPEWFHCATRRSTTVGEGYLPEEDFANRIADYGKENGDNEDALFSKLITPSPRNACKSPGALRTPNLSIGGAVTPEAVRWHLTENWSFAREENREHSGNSNNLSLARARVTSASWSRGRNLSNWRGLSAARARGISSSIQSVVHRENSLSVSMALVSFQYALMRRSTVTPVMDDDAFHAKLEEFAAEHETLMDEQWLMFKKLTPNVSCYSKEL